MHDPALAHANALVDANPHVRAAANTAGIRLADIRATGPGGRHTLDDVHQAVPLLSTSSSDTS